MPAGAPKILIVDDDAIIRMATEMHVSMAGYAYISAANADEAISLLATDPLIRVLITDINMPGSQDGWRLARAVRERWPPVGIIIISGEPNLLSRSCPANWVRFAKPYMPADLSKAIAVMVTA